MKMKFKRVVAFLLTVMMAFSTAGSDMMSVYASAFTAQTDAPDEQTGQIAGAQLMCERASDLVSLFGEALHLMHGKKK